MSEILFKGARCVLHRSLFFNLFLGISIANAGSSGFGPEVITEKRNGADIEIAKIFTGYKESERCTEKISRENIQLNNIVEEAILESKWQKEYALEANYTIAIQTKNTFTIYSGGKEKQTNDDDVIEVIKILNDNKIIEFCNQIKKTKDGQSLILTLIKPEVDEWKVNGYQLIYPDRSMASQEKKLTQLANKLGKFLLVHSDKLGEDAFLEIGRTVIHEGMHLFGQQQIIAAEPLSPDPAIRGRAYLQMNDSQYRELVQAEICLNAKMIEKIIEYPVDVRQQEKNDLMILELLIQSISVSEIRQEQFQTKALESYWYFLEGLPQYLDQNYLKKKNPQKLIRIYRNFCSDKEAQAKIFFPNMAGAALFMGVEYVFENIFDGDESWKEALKLEYEQVQRWRSELIIKRLFEQRLNASIIGRTPISPRNRNE